MQTKQNETEQNETKRGNRGTRSQWEDLYLPITLNPDVFIYTSKSIQMEEFVENCEFFLQPGIFLASDINVEIWQANVNFLLNVCQSIFKKINKIVLAHGIELDW
jgi:hypothetical protein